METTRDITQSPPPTPDTPLLQQWAPILYLHPQEAYLPCSVDWYLQYTSLNDPTQPEPVYSPVINGTTRTDSSCLADQFLGQRRNWTLDILDPAAQAGYLPGAKCYAYKRPVTDASGNLVAYDLNYWFFYAFNGNIFDMGQLQAYVAAAIGVSALTWFIPGINLVSAYLLGATSLTGVLALLKTAGGVGLHEGDWEFAVVRVDPTGSQVLGTYYSAHAGENPWTTSFPTQNGRPVVYVAKSSHANYTTVGTIDRLGGLADDVTSDQGPVWDTQAAICDVGYDPNASVVATWGTPVRFDAGGNPSVAANSDGLVASVHRSNSTYYWNAGQVVDGAVQWWSAKGTAFDGGDNDIAIAINDQGLVVSVHRSGSTNLYWNAGVVDPVKKVVTWFGKGQKYDVGHGDPAVTLNNAGTVLSVHAGQKALYYNAGVLKAAGSGDHEAAIDWARGGQGTSLNVKGVDPVIVVNELNDVVVAYTSGGTIYTLVGVYDPATQLLTMPATPLSYGKGANPQLALDDDGQVMLVYSLDGQLYYNSGEIGDLDKTTRCIRWTPSANSNYASANGVPAITLTNSDTFVEVHRNDNDLIAIVGSLAVDGFSGYQPLNAQYWMKYSGRFGKPGTPPILDIGGYTLAEYDTGPPGPSQRGMWINGPD